MRKAVEMPANLASILSQTGASVCFLPPQVTAVEPVSSAGGLQAPGFALGEQLRLFFGVVAVGTEGGHTYLVDTRADEGKSCDEVTARGSRVISPRLTDLGTVREKAASKGEHLCLHLDGQLVFLFSF